jgi:thiol-disulfide isomerase/thioredoxin
MKPIGPGSFAPVIPGSRTDAVRAIFFYKVTCPVCQMAAPRLGDLARAFPGHVVGVGQDPPQELADFEGRFGMALGSRADLPPYDLSNAYGVRVVPTTFLLAADGAVLDVVESWDRAGLNGLARRLADLTGSEFRPVSSPDDGLPPYRPG